MPIYLTIVLVICLLLVGPLVVLLIPFSIADVIDVYQLYILGALFAVPCIAGVIYFLSVGLHPLRFLRPGARNSTLDIEQFFVNPIHIAGAKMIEQVLLDYANRTVTRPEQYGEEAARDFRRYFHLMEVYRDRGFQFHWRLGAIDPEQMAILASRDGEGAVVEYVGECQYWIERNGVRYRRAEERPEEGIERVRVTIRLQYVEVAPQRYRLLAWEDNAIGLHLHTISLDAYEHRSNSNS